MSLLLQNGPAQQRRRNMVVALVVAATWFATKLSNYDQAKLETLTSTFEYCKVSNLITTNMHKEKVTNSISRGKKHNTLQFV